MRLTLVVFKTHIVKIMTKIMIKVITGAKKQEIRKESDYFKIYLKSKPEKEKANKELIDLLSCHFNIPKTNIKIIKGHHSKNKLIEFCKR